MLYRNIAAANEEDGAGYMATIHPDSPGIATTEAALYSLFQTYDLSYDLADVRLESETEDEARVYALLTTRSSGGPSFGDNRVTAIFVLRKFGDEWHLWTQEILNIEYL